MPQSKKANSVRSTTPRQGTVALGESLVVHLLKGLVMRFGEPIQG
jgi:hypothetical protein